MSAHATVLPDACPHCQLAPVPTYYSGGVYRCTRCHVVVPRVATLVPRPQRPLRPIRRWREER